MSADKHRNKWIRKFVLANLPAPHFRRCRWQRKRGTEIVMAGYLQEPSTAGPSRASVDVTAAVKHLLKRGKVKRVRHRKSRRMGWTTIEEA